jgi:hypothetical protein
MRRFLIVGCGGSGGATIRFIQDQLLADLRPEGTTALPDGWQFVHIDVPTTPDRGPGPLGSVRDMGGRYLSVSSLGNTYDRAATQLFQATAGRLDTVAGWVPSPAICTVPVTEGAGQFRAVGRTLTLTRLADIQSVLKQAFEDLQKPDPWNGISGHRRAKVSQGGDIIPIVIGSMAGGSGASMFLDVARLLGSLPGIDARSMGAFLFTADVFRALDEDMRLGVEGNALGAIGDIIAAQTGVAHQADSDLLSALGVSDVAPFAFARVFPIGSAIGGDGAVFGDGTTEGIYRGIGRALAALMLSDVQHRYVAHTVGNPTPTPTEVDTFGWGTQAEAFAWGSFGYASLSLGRDRYAEYAAQRLARSAADRLIRGHEDGGTTTSTEQLKAKADALWPQTITRLGLPQAGRDPAEWFRTVAMDPELVRSETRRVIADTVAMINATQSAGAADWYNAVISRFPHFREPARDALGKAAYAWTERYGADLEQRVIAEVLDGVRRLGLPYAREVVLRLQSHLDVVINTLQGAPDPNAFDPLAINPSVGTRIQAMKRAVISAGHEIVDVIAGDLATSAGRVLQTAGARYTAALLESFKSDVLGPLEQSLSFVLKELEASRDSTEVQAGLAQLRTSVYREWPDDSDHVPTRFAHAENEILLTTAAEFPQLFENHVARSAGQGLPYADALGDVVGQVIRGEWTTTGGQLGKITVADTTARWRASVLTYDSETGEPTPRAMAAYRLHFGPAALLERARLYIERPGEPFAVYRSETIGEYLNDGTLPLPTLETRKDEFARKFAEALRMARPLVGVDPGMIQAVHPGKSLTYTYVISKMGLREDDAVVQRIRAGIEADPTLDASVLSALEAATGEGATESRIAIFGSYPKYSPVVFSSLLDTIQKRFQTVPDAARADLWRWKSTRPLSASLPLSPAELRALVAGWYVGRLTGLVRTGSATDPVVVRDPANDRWMPLVWPMLTDPARITSVDWLPVALESYSLALVQSNRDPELRALLPYRALRRIWDATPNGPGSRDALGGFAALANIESWLRDGMIAGADPSAVVADATALSSEERRTKAREWIATLQGWLSAEMLREGTGANYGRSLGRVDSPAALYDKEGVSRVRFVTVAPLVREVLHEIDELVRTASVAPPIGTDGLPPAGPPVVM